MLTFIRDSLRALSVMGAVALLAVVATFAAWSLTGGLEQALSPTLSMLIVAAPVALALAAPRPLLSARRRGRPRPGSCWTICRWATSQPS